MVELSGMSLLGSMSGFIKLIVLLFDLFCCEIVFICLLIGVG